MKRTHIRASDLRGLHQLAIDVTVGLTDVVESMHATIMRAPAIFGEPRPRRTTGITRFVYRSVRGVTRLVGVGIDALMALRASPVAERQSSSRREAIRSAINGVLGDHLAASDNPLRITMSLRSAGRRLEISRSALTAAFPRPARKMLVLVHGLCMNDLQWARDGHEHGEALARDLGYTPIYLHYNTGLHISANGRQFADLMEAVLHEWPHPIERLTLIGHSMGGLVARSACHYASLAAHAWVKRLDDLIFLGTPHLGAPLERAGTRVDWVIGMSPYTAPLARLGRTRSAGINDLGHGYLLDEDWQAPTKSRPSRGRPVPLPASVKCYAVAASKQRRPDARRAKMRGDGFVPVESALGRHRDPSLELDFPDPHRWVGFGMSHFDLLSRRDMYEKIRFWLGETYVRPKSTAAKSGHALGALG